MSDEAIGREIRQLREDIRDDLGEIKAQLSQLLPREVYTAHHEAIKTRVSKLESDLDALETRGTATRRWIVTAVVVPTVTMIVTIVLAVWRP